MSVMTTRATGAGAMAMVVAPGYQFQLEEIQLHCSAVGGAGTGNLTVTMDGGAAAAVYDVNVLTQAMVAVSDLIFIPERPIRCTYSTGVPATSDHLDLVWDNANAVTWGCTVIYSPI